MGKITADARRKIIRTRAAGSLTAWDLNIVNCVYCEFNYIQLKIVSHLTQWKLHIRIKVS